MKRKSGFMRKVKDDDAVCKSYGPEFPATLQQTAGILQGKGCSPKHIQAACFPCAVLTPGSFALSFLVFFKDFSQLFQNPRDYGRIDIFRLNMSEQKRIGHDNGRIKAVFKS